MLSQKFRAAIYLSPKRQYQIAWEAGLHPATLSKLINGIEKPKPSDPRILKIGEVLGLSEEECFEGESTGQGMGGVATEV